jgi:PAS domain S-box-containing protein
LQISLQQAVRSLSSLDVPQIPPDFLNGGGDLARLIAEFNWSETPLGPIASWSAPLRTATGIILRSPLAMVIMWGRDGILIYNQGYAEISGQRHPATLGAKTVDAWPEVAAFNAHVIDTVLAGGTLSFKNQRFTLFRNGAAEDVWLDLAYSPICDERGEPAGVLAAVVETSARFLADERLRIAQHVGRFGTFEWFPQQQRVVASGAYRDIYGLPPTGDITDAQLLALMPPEDVAKTGHGRIGLEENPLAYAEYRIRRADTGEVRWIARRGEILSAGEAAGERYIGVAWDITEKKRAELNDAFLASISDRLRDVSDAGGIVETAARMLGAHLGVGRVGFGEIDDSGATVIVEHEWTDGAMPSLAGPFALAGFGSAALARLHAGKTVRMNDCRQNSAFTEPGIAAAFEQIGMRAGIAVPLVRDGRFKGLLYAHSATPRTWDDGEAAVVQRVALRTWDAAQRARAERRLRDSEQTFREFAQAMPVKVWAANPQGQLYWFNDQVFTYTGAAHGQLEAAGWVDYFHPDDRASLITAWTKSLRNGSNYATEGRLRRHDGAWRWHINRASPIRGEAGQILRWIGTNTDIEEQRRALAELAELNATLEQRVAERTESLRIAEEALRQAQKMEAIGQLTGGIAHDFNNLLTGITGSLAMIQRRLAAGRTGDIDRFMEAATSSAQRAAALTHRLLAFARRQSLDMKPVAVDALVEGMADLLRRTLGEQVQLRLALASRAWHALTDPHQLESAILNLAINARDAMPAGGELTIETNNLVAGEAQASGAAEPEALEPGAYIAIAVSDTGTGIPLAVIDKVFEPFFTTKPVGQGTGLGLSMVYGFTRQSGGQVRIKSVPGEGTVVTLYLPRVVAAPDADAKLELAIPVGAGQTVLVIEDNPAVRMVIVEVLRELGYHALEAGDAEAAMPVIESSRPIDLLVSDVGLPGMNGRQIAEHARRSRPSLKVLFVTGYAEGAASRSGFLAPGMAMMTKPFAIEALASKISEMMAM